MILLKNHKVILLSSMCIALTYAHSLRAAAHNEKPNLLQRLIKRSKGKKKKTVTLMPPPIVTVQRPPLTGLSESNIKLRTAIQADNIEEVKCLLEQGIDVNLSEMFGADMSDSDFVPVISTPLWYAAECGNPAILQLLVAAGGDVHQPSQERDSYCKDLGLTPLQVLIFNCPKYPPAALRQNVEILINAGADANILAKRPIYCYGLFTCMLHTIASAKLSNRDAFPIIAALVKGGAQKTFVDYGGLTADQYSLYEFRNHKNKSLHCYNEEKATMFAARAAFIRSYPGMNLQERAVFALILHAYSNDKETAANAQAQISWLTTSGVSQCALAMFKIFCQDCPMSETLQKHANQDPFFRESEIEKIKYNVDSVAVWDPKLLKNARRLKIKRRS